MPLLEKERIELAKSVNLVDWLKMQGANIVKVGTGEYTLKEHDSLRISYDKNVWIRNSNKTAGDGISFLQEFYGMDFRQAVKSLTPDWTGQRESSEIRRQIDQFKTSNTKKEEKKIITEKEAYTKGNDNRRTIAYLCKSRGLDSDIVVDLIKQNKITQDNRGNAVFRITDEKGEWKGAEIVGTLTEKRFKKFTPETGYGWTMEIGKPQKVLFFESAIDTISFYQLNQSQIKDMALVSLAGSTTREKTLISTIERYKKNYNIPDKNFFLCVDRDEAGDKLIYNMKKNHNFNCSVYRVNNSDCKDWNDLLIKKNEEKWREPVKRQYSASGWQKKANERKSMQAKEEKVEQRNYSRER